jgi:hypothetical protein
MTTKACLFWSARANSSGKDCAAGKVAGLRWAIAGPSPKAKPAMTKQSRLRHAGGCDKENTDGMDLRKWTIAGFALAIELDNLAPINIRNQ